ncbi:hypothetical protein [Novosphingobium album (ex Liu et al. 2023)]|nr:hypothetical protein [Novosphingobium album (ex Liu et al. 2023)]
MWVLQVGTKVKPRCGDVNGGSNRDARAAIVDHKLVDYARAATPSHDRSNQQPSHDDEEAGERRAPNQFNPRQFIGRFYKIRQQDRGYACDGEGNLCAKNASREILQRQKRIAAIIAGDYQEYWKKQRANGQRFPQRRHAKMYKGGQRESCDNREEIAGHHGDIKLKTKLR